MSFEKAKADLEEKGLGDHVIVLNESSATVAEAAHALGVEPASIAKTLSVLQGEKPVLIVTEGTAKLDNHKEYCRLCTLRALDDGWVEEVDYLQQLRAAISGRSSAQRNLLFEYQREARISFEDMEKSIKKAMIRNILLGEVSFGKDNEMIILYP